MALSLKDSVEAALSEREDRKCKLGRFRLTLTEEDQQAFDQLIDSGLSLKKTHDIIKKYVDVSMPTVYSHRRKDCACH